MRYTAAFCITALVVVSLGCGDPQPDQTDNPMPADPGAGSVLRVDPALDAIVPADYHIEKLADGFAFTEGPVWVSEGSYLLFSDLRSNRIHKWDVAEGLSTFMDPYGCLAGLACLIAQRIERIGGVHELLEVGVSVPIAVQGGVRRIVRIEAV